MLQFERKLARLMIETSHRSGPTRQETRFHASRIHVRAFSPAARPEVSRMTLLNRWYKNETARSRHPRLMNERTRYSVRKVHISIEKTLTIATKNSAMPNSRIGR